MSPDARLRARRKNQNSPLFLKRNGPKLKQGIERETGKLIPKKKRVKLRGKSPMGRQRVMWAEQMAGKRTQKHNGQSGGERTKAGRYIQYSIRQRGRAETRGEAGGEGHDHGEWRGYDRAGERGRM